VDLNTINSAQRIASPDAGAEEELAKVLVELVVLCGERSGGITVTELASRLGRESDLRGLRELLERGRLAVEDGDEAAGRFAVVERVYEDPNAFWQSRYIATSFGRMYISASETKPAS